MGQLGVSRALVLAALAAGCDGGGDDAPRASSGAGGAAGSAGSAGASAGGGYGEPCDIDSGFPGDDLCIRPPAVTDGFQLHYGPADYSDESAAPFVLEPGEEITDCLVLTTPNEAEVYWQEYHTRARPGTHHIIVFGGSVPSSVADGTLGDCEYGTDMQFLVGAQSGLDERGVVLDVPLPGEAPAPENAGLGWRLPPRKRVAFQMHYVNVGTTPILREGWINFHDKPAAAVETVVDPIFFIGGLGMAVAPHTEETIVADACELPADGPDSLRILGVSGHAHAHTTRFSAWINRNDGSRQLFYNTYDWEEPLNAQFDSAHDYPAPQLDGEQEGALSGVVEIARGETIDWECYVVNDTEDITLGFGNKAYDAEMCNLFGYYAPGTGAPWDCLRF